MTIPAPPPSAPGPVRRLNNQPYLLLSLTALFRAGNIVLARYVAGHVPPMTCPASAGSALLPFGVRLTRAQLAGIAISAAASTYGCGAVSLPLRLRAG